MATMVVGSNPPIHTEAKAGRFGVAAVVFYGIFAVVAVFVAAFFWLDGDQAMAAVFGIGSLAIPVTTGFFVAEMTSQRVGALAFVVTAAVVAGAASASAWMERDEYFENRETYFPSEYEAERSLNDDAREILRDLTD